MSSPRINISVAQQEHIGSLAAQIGEMTGGYAPSVHQLGRTLLELGAECLTQRMASGQAKHGAAGFAQIVADAQQHAAQPQGALSPAERDQIRDTLRAALRPDAAA